MQKGFFIFIIVVFIKIGYMILFQTLFFKFTEATTSVAIF
jgi:hypothetical protein